MSKEHCAKYRGMVLLLCEELGWVVNLEKSKLVSQNFCCLGGHLPDFLLCSPYSQELDLSSRLCNPSSKHPPFVLSFGSWSSGFFKANPTWFVSVTSMSIHFSEISLGFGTSAGILRAQRALCSRMRGEQTGDGWTSTPINLFHCLFMNACPMGWGAHLEGDMLQGKWELQEQ